MADEQLTLTIEQLSESVRTAMTREDAEEPLSQLTELIDRESSSGRLLPELTGQVFRSLLPAFVMTDADFKTPASLAAPTKAMYSVKEQCLEWLFELCEKCPNISNPTSLDRAAYRRRMRMSVEDDPEVDENTSPSNDLDSPETSEPGEAVVDAVVLDPVVALMERLAVRCPDKAEWRRSACESIVRISERMKVKKIGDRYVEKFLLNLMVSEKAAWRGFACEAGCGLASCVSLETARAIHQALIKRCRDAVSGVRAKAMTSIFQNTCESVEVLKERINDEKPSVRRAAVTLFDTLASSSSSFSFSNGEASVPLGIISALARDESLMVRKASISSVLSLVDSRTAEISKQVSDLYVNTVLPMVTDVETSVVEKVSESFELCVVNGLIKLSSSSSSFLPQKLEAILTSIGGSKESLEFARRCLKFVVRKFNDAKLNKSIVKNLEVLVSQCTSSEARSPLICVVLLSFLEELAHISLSLLTVNRYIASYFPVLITLSHGEEALIECLKIVELLIKSKKIDFSDSDFLKKLILFLNIPNNNCRLNVLHFAIRCIPSDDPCLDSLSSKAMEAMDSVVFPAAAPLDDYGHILWNVVIIGELALLGHLPSAKGLTALEAIATNRVYHNGTDHLGLPASLRAAAMVAFGQICLQKESIAKRAISKFAAHLSKQEHPIVRNNVLIVLGDLCVVYTGLVDQYLPWLTTCLSDQSDLIRLQAAVVVASLLAEDYIKFKGQIVFRLLYLLSDPNEKIKNFIESVFSRILFLRHSGSLKTLFAETVCALNGYLRHPAYQGALSNKDFCLTFNLNRRREIYAFMLTNIVTTEQKFNATVQLANSLLTAFVDEDLTNGAVVIPDRDDGPAGQVLIDTLFLLSHPGLKLSSATAVAEAESEDKEVREKRLFDSALQKKTVVENLVPLLIQLNSLCERKRSPISKHVRDCLKELVKDYRDEVVSILHSDSQLAHELLYDLGLPPREAEVEPQTSEESVSAPKVVIQEEHEIDVEPPTKKQPVHQSSSPTDVKKEEDEEGTSRRGNSTRLARKRRID